MGDYIKAKYKIYLGYLLSIIVVGVVTYLLVYKVSFLPNGYDVVSQQENSISIKTFNVLGVKEGISTVTFTNGEVWRIDEIDFYIRRYKEFLWLLSSTVIISLILLTSKIRKGMKLGKAIVESNIVVAVLIPMPHIIHSLNRLHYLIS